MMPWLSTLISPRMQVRRDAVSLIDYRIFGYNALIQKSFEERRFMEMMEILLSVMPTKTLSTLAFSSNQTLALIVRNSLQAQKDST